MTLYCNKCSSRTLSFINTIRHQAISTFKSKHDEVNNQDLLRRLKKVSVIGGKKAVPRPPPQEVIIEGALPERNLPLEKLQKMLTLYQTDPLIWNPSVLGRIFKIPESYCAKLAIYVMPMIYWHDAFEQLEVQTIIKTTFVVDVGRLKSDNNYLVLYKRIMFPDQNALSLPKKALPEYLDELEKIESQRLGRKKTQEGATNYSNEDEAPTLSSPSRDKRPREEIS